VLSSKKLRCESFELSVEYDYESEGMYYVPFLLLFMYHTGIVISFALSITSVCVDLQFALLAKSGKQLDFPTTMAKVYLLYRSTSCWGYRCKFKSGSN